MNHYLLVNFGGPRNLEEVPSFLQELLCDPDVIRTPLPRRLNHWLFSQIAKKRSVKVSEDYELIGGGSPIYFDTENLAKALREKLQAPIYTFHRYLKATHTSSLDLIKQIPQLTVIPLFPQFSYATTGSIARFFSLLPNQLFWIKSYPAHPAFIRAYQRRIREFLHQNLLKEEETLLLFSAHGLPASYVKKGDVYQAECQLSYQQVMQSFPLAKSRLCYQSKFGPGEWLKPYTKQACEQILDWHEGRKNIVIIPISFTSDHIETLFEIEYLYLTLIRKKELNAYRCPALNLEPYWIDALAEIIRESELTPNAQLVRPC